MIQPPSLEREFERAAAEDRHAKVLWHRYEATKDYLETTYYRWVQAECPYYTDHGQVHIESVISTASMLLSKHVAPNDADSLSVMDIFLILSAIIWHDVGMVYGRSGHADRVAEMTKEIRELAFPSPTIHRLVVEIAKAHSSPTGLRDTRVEDHCQVSTITYRVAPRAIAAIVRFADEVSETRARISLGLLPRVPLEQQIYWQYAMSVATSVPEPERDRVVINYELQADNVLARYAPGDFVERAGDDGLISLLEYVLCRLEKINNERTYCGPYLVRYAAVREVCARFTILRNDERVPGFDNLQVITSELGLDHAEYPDIPLAAPFFERYPGWRPDTLQAALNT